MVSGTAPTSIQRYVISVQPPAGSEIGERATVSGCPCCGIPSMTGTPVAGVLTCAGVVLLARVVLAFALLPKMSRRTGSSSR